MAELVDAASEILAPRDRGPGKAMDWPSTSRRWECSNLIRELAFLVNSCEDLERTADLSSDGERGGEGRRLESIDRGIVHLKFQLKDCNDLASKLEKVYGRYSSKFKRLNPKINGYLKRMRKSLDVCWNSAILLNAELQRNMQIDQRNDTRDLLHYTMMHWSSRERYESRSRSRPRSRKDSDSDISPSWIFVPDGNESDNGVEYIRKPEKPGRRRSDHDVQYIRRREDPRRRRYDDVQYIPRRVDSRRRSRYPEVLVDLHSFNARFFFKKGAIEEEYPGNGILDLKSDGDFLTYSFAKTSGILEGAEEIMKPKEVVGPGGRLVRPTQEVEVRWTVLSGEDVDKTQNTRFYILDSAEVRKNMVLGKSYADFDGIFGNHETSVYKWKLPHKSRKQRAAEATLSAEHRDAALREEQAELDAEREERRQRFATTSPSAASVLSVRSGSPPMPPVGGDQPDSMVPSIQVVPPTSLDLDAASSSGPPRQSPTELS